MGSFANSLFTILLGWIQLIVSSLWSAISGEGGSAFLDWFGQHWLMVAGVLCIIGLTVDLGVYLFRWRPLKVLRSFMRRLRPDQEEETAAPDTESHFSRNEELEAWQAPTGTEMDDDEDDLARWQSDKPEPEREPISGKPRSGTLITGAGYTVPADSPYRRPKPAETESVEPGGDPDDIRTERTEVMTQRKRRRRLIVSDLFTEPEEELMSYVAPQQLIDKDKAYHQPVYPTGWQKNGKEE